MSYTPQQMAALDPAQMLKRRRYGQIPGGIGYQQTRTSLGRDEYTPDRVRQASQTSGYDPRTAGRLFGGRPAQGSYPQPQTERAAQPTQMQAVTQQPWTARSMALQPWGGTAAVRRRRYIPQFGG